jgi:hypothetical protein
VVAVPARFVESAGCGCSNKHPGPSGRRCRGPRPYCSRCSPVFRRGGPALAGGSVRAGLGHGSHPSSGWVGVCAKGPSKGSQKPGPTLRQPEDNASAGACSAGCAQGRPQVHLGGHGRGGRHGSPVIWVETQRDERRELDEVRDRLMARFPEIPQPDVASVVEGVYLALDGPIRDYTSRSWWSTLPGTGWPASPQRADGAVRGSGCELLAHGSLRLLPVEILDHQIGLGGAVERRAPSELTDEFCRRNRSVLAIPAKPVSPGASSREDQDMSFQAYLDMIEDKYGPQTSRSTTEGSRYDARGRRRSGWSLCQRCGLNRG